MRLPRYYAASRQEQTAIEYIWEQKGCLQWRREEIVRCRDCVFFAADVSTVDERGEQIAAGNLCEWTELWVEPDGYCAWAERRDA